MCTLCPHIGDAKELEVVDAMDAEDHGESVHEFLLERDPHILISSYPHMADPPHSFIKSRKRDRKSYREIYPRAKIEDHEVSLKVTKGAENGIL